MSEENIYFVSCLSEFMAEMDEFLLCGLEVLEVGHQHQLSFHSGKMYDMLDEHACLYGIVALISFHAGLFLAVGLLLHRYFISTNLN